MMDIRSYELLKKAAFDDEQAEAELLRINTLEELAQKQHSWRNLFLELIGGLPEKVSLQQQVTGRICRKDFTVEKILFRSGEGRYVTGSLYLPCDKRYKPPYPALLIFCGHSNQGKAAPRYHKMAVMAVREGFGVFEPDPISQGERIQLDQLFPFQDCAIEHASLGARSWLLGWNFARYRIHDGICSIDYMETRKELDLSRLAVAGNSGGGTMSTYMQAFDERIKAACPNCYISSLREVIGERGVHDAEQFFYGQLPRGFNHAVMLALGLGRTALLAGARHSDYFPVTGTRSTLDVLHKLREKLKIAPPLCFYSCDGPHGWAYSSCLAALSFLKYAVKGEKDRFCIEENGNMILDAEALRSMPEDFPDFEEELSEKELQVTASGQVRDLPGAKSLYTLFAEEALRLRKSRVPDRARLRETVRRCAQIHPLDQLPAEPESFVHDFKWWYLYGKEGYSVELYAGILAAMGRSLIGERAEMYLRSTLKEREKNGSQKIVLRAEGDWCIAAAHAYAAEPELFSAVEFTDPPPSWTDMLQNPDPSGDSFAVTVWGALREYDWTDLVPENIRICHYRAAEKN